MITKTALIIVCICLLTAVRTADSRAEGAGGPGLSPQQRGIVPIAAFTAKGDMDSLKKALNEGLDLGLTINEIKQVLVQMYAYCGFPRSLNALAVFSETLDERAKKGIRDEEGKKASPFPPAGKTSLELGAEVQAKLVGAPVKGGIMDFAPDIDEFLKAHLFGDIFGRDNLDWKDREIATVSALASMDGTAPQLRGHLRYCMNAGTSEAQMKELAGIVGDKAGKQAGEDLEKLLTEVLNSR